MKVLLTGYSGFLGHYLFKALKNAGFSVRVLLHRHTLARKELGTDIEVVWGSFDNLDVIRHAVNGVAYVVHSAWNFSSPFEERPTVNERGTATLFSESINATVKKFALISSVAVYGMRAAGRSVIVESDRLAQGRDLQFIYPSEKISVEKTLKEFDRKKTSLGIFRPGPIFDETKSPAKKVIRIGPWYFGIGVGNGRNRMAYIHASDVARSVVTWLASGNDGAIFNVVPTKCMRSKEWIRAWGLQSGLDLKVILIPGSAVRLAGLGVKVLKRCLGKQSRGDLKYAIACAKRNLCYSNESLRQSIGWTDEATSEYTKGN